MVTYGDFGFRRVVARAHRLAGRASAGRNVVAGGGVYRRCRPGSVPETVAGSIGEGAGASGIAARSTRLSARGEAGPCRVMT